MINISIIYFKPLMILYLITTFLILFYLYIFWYAPKKAKVLQDRPIIYYFFKKKIILFSAIKSIDLIQFSSKRQNRPPKIRVITKEKKYFTIFNFYHNEYDILNTIKKSIEKEK